ncbi:MAG: glycyl-radical enzyme activating protein [Fidelibacterota bacterium]
MTEGIIFDIKHFATHDGPGIRTTVFMKGCPLDCWWCHNPESKNPDIEQNISGGHREKSIIGEKYSVDQLFQEIIKDELFFDESGGGVTFSGGEAMLQTNFLVEILKKLKQRGIHTVIDTSGYCDRVSFDKVIPYTDLFLYDIKLMDSKIHAKYTGKSNNLILSNFQYLMSQEVNMTVRIPLIPGITDTYENLTDIRDFLRSYKMVKVELIPYNKLGESKIYKYLDQDKIGKLETQSSAKVRELQQIFED